MEESRSGKAREGKSGKGPKCILGLRAVTRIVRSFRQDGGDSGQVRGELPRSDRICLLRKSRNVALNWRIEVDLSLLGEPEESGRGERLGNAIDTELRLRRHRNLPPGVGVAEAGGPDDLIVERDRYGRSRIELEDVGEQPARALDRTAS
jgi:hypothetical protein